jgi:CBS-domain-containing membrane protein
MRQRGTISLFIKNEKEYMKTTKAADIMTTNVITAKKDMLLTDVIALLLRWHISALPVVDDEDKMIGIVSEIDLVNLTFDGNAADTTVEEIMVTDIVSFSPNTELADLVQTFSKRHLRRVPIIDEGKVVGIISRRDILREILHRYK